MSSLSEIQQRIAALFFSLDSTAGFLLAGGGAMLATGLSTRPTHDLDFFGTNDLASIPTIRQEFMVAVRSMGWHCEVVQEGPSFVRLLVRSESSIVIDIAHDSPPVRPPLHTFIGPTFSQQELAGRKMAALFGRAEARDFVDVFFLSDVFSQQELESLAGEIDLGITRLELAQMMRTINRFKDEDFPIDSHNVTRLRDFFHQWARQLEVDPSDE